MNVQLPDPVTLIVVLGALALVPFIAIMVTSFVKLAVVLTLIRQALGVQSIPPNSAIYGLAIILTVYIMAPVGMSVYDDSRTRSCSSPAGPMLREIEQAAEPFRTSSRSVSGTAGLLLPHHALDLA